MTSSKTTDAPAGSSLKAYEDFHQVADRGDYRKAITIFKAQPHLMNHMTLLEISVHCRLVSDQLAKREVLLFIESVERRMLQTVRVLELARLYDREVWENKRRHKGV